MKELVMLEEEILNTRISILMMNCLFAPKRGFADCYIAKLLDLPEREIRERRIALGIIQGWEPVPVSGAKCFYYYSTYNSEDKPHPTTEKSYDTWRRPQPYRTRY